MRLGTTALRFAVMAEQMYQSVPDGFDSEFKPVEILVQHMDREEVAKLTARLAHVVANAIEADASCDALQCQIEEERDSINKLAGATIPKEQVLTMLQQIEDTLSSVGYRLPERPAPCDCE